MSKITNDGLTRYGTGCLIAISIRQQWACQRVKDDISVSILLLYTMSQKTSKIIFVITTSNFHQIWQFLVQSWQIVQNYMRCTHYPSHLIYVNAIPC